MAFEKKKTPTEIAPAALDQFLNSSKDTAVLENEKTTPLSSPKTTASPGISIADLIPTEEKDVKFPISLPFALHRELKRIAQEEAPSLHALIIRTLAEKVIQSRGGK